MKFDPPNLTKEDFWNNLQDRYPAGMKVFCDWIDQYKKKVSWNDLFWNTGLPDRKDYWSDIKYHDLPLAMQVGIFIEFVSELPAEIDMGLEVHSDNMETAWLSTCINGVIYYLNEHFKK